MRVRWFEVTGAPISIGAIRTKLLKDEYRTNRSSGFRLEPGARSEINGRFIERIEYEAEVEDPFGRIEVQSRVEYRQLRFTILESLPQIQVNSPPRSCKVFLNRLAEHLGDTAQIRVPVVSMEWWLSAVERQAPRVQVHLIEASNIRLSDNAHARVLVAGPEDVRRVQSNFVTGHSTVLERVGLSWAGGEARCELSGEGRALVEKGDLNSVALVLRNALGAAARRQVRLPASS
ncbi:hypothetical protein [Myxococcus sp. Y35]|uniref:hypothetical protein n=1 Tax=Pseudomyxococcus flavus TaxID=3115648 RepID=UPI003CF72DDB